MIQEIVKGIHDAELDQIAEAIKRRRKYLSEAKFFDFSTDNLVKLKGLTPKYLNGLTGKVVGKKTKRISVSLDSPPLGFGKIVNVPPSCLDKV